MDFKQLFRNKWLLVLGIIGISCLLFGSFWNQSVHVLKPSSGTSSQPPNSPTDPTASPIAATDANTSAPSGDPMFTYEQFYSKQLTNILSGMVGIHNVSVMVTVDSTANQEIANNTRTTRSNSNGSASSNSVTTETDVYSQRNSDGSETPFVTKQLTPQVRGVLVMVRADDFYLAKQEIIDAIEHVLDVPAYKISVEPKQDNP